jgi:hypothetical protein
MLRRPRGERHRRLLFLLVAVTLLLSYTRGVQVGKKTKKTKKKHSRRRRAGGSRTAAQELAARLDQLAPGAVQAQAEAREALRKVAEVLKPLEDGESWELADGTNTLEPYAVGTTALADALTYREREPPLWAELGAEVDALASGRSQPPGGGVAGHATTTATAADAGLRLMGTFRRWAELSEAFGEEASWSGRVSKDVLAGAELLGFLAPRARAATGCLLAAASDRGPRPRCSDPDAWVAARALEDSVRPDGATKHARRLRAHDLEFGAQRSSRGADVPRPPHSARLSQGRRSRCGAWRARWRGRTGWT